MDSGEIATMQKDALRQFVTLRRALLQEREKLRARLRQIEAALSGPEGATSGVGRRLLPKLKNPMPLKDAIIKVTSNGPKTKQEILQGIKKLGYRFATSDPMNSLNVILYGRKPKFKNDGGKFSPGK